MFDFCMQFFWKMDRDSRSPANFAVDTNRIFRAIIQFDTFIDSFDVIYDIDDSILKYETLNLILQPILENAIHHGIDNIETVIVHRKLDIQICFDVRDLIPVKQDILSLI